MKEKKLKYSDEELIKLYRGAADKNKQIEILADMRVCKPQEIIKMLADAGEIPGMRKMQNAECKMQNAEIPRTARNDITEKAKGKKMKAPRWTSEELEQLQGYIDEGFSYSEIADRFGRNKQSIYDAVSKHGLKGARKMQDVLPGKKKEMQNAKCKMQNEEIPLTGTVTNHSLRNDNSLPQSAEPTVPSSDGAEKACEEEGKGLDNPSSVSKADTFSTGEKAMEEQENSNVTVAVFKDMKGLEETQRSAEIDMLEIKQENRWIKNRAEDVEQILITISDFVKILRLGLSDICEDAECTQDTMLGQVAELLKDARLVLKEVYDD